MSEKPKERKIRPARDDRARRRDETDRARREIMPKDPDHSQPAAENDEEPTAAENAWSESEISVEEPGVSEVPDAFASDAGEGDVGAAAETEKGAGVVDDAWWSPPVTPAPWNEPEPSAQDSSALVEAPASSATISVNPEPLPESSNTFFSGDTSFFTLNGALHAIAKHKLTGTLRFFWDREIVELLAKNGEIILATTRDAEQTVSARAHQHETGCPLFLTLARDGLILREPAMQLVQHYGQKLFAELWGARRVRFVFELSEQLPDYANDVTGEGDIDYWALSALRLIQFKEHVRTPDFDDTCIPGYTRDGFERVQKLRFTIAEAQFASQFDGARSLAQIAKNLRLDITPARLTLFRFLALEIVECWPANVVAKPERRGIFQRVGRSLGMGD
ncbi:MAG: DUF4388 domain-containing protein [Chthoniobacterales bacterium]